MKLFSLLIFTVIVNTFSSYGCASVVSQSCNNSDDITCQVLEIEADDGSIDSGNIHIEIAYE